MKASMEAAGTLVLIPENGIEAFAMFHWGEKNLLKNCVNMIIDYSNFPSMLMVHASDCAVHNEPAFPAGECDCGVKS